MADHDEQQHVQGYGRAEVEARYRQQVAGLYGPLSFQGLERGISLQDISLEDVFVKLTLTVERVVRRRVERPTEEAAGERFRLFGHRGEAGRQREAERAEREVEIVERVQEPISLSKALAEHPSLLISGEPGAGKTTLLRWLAVTFARDLQRQPDRLGPEFAEPGTVGSGKSRGDGSPGQRPRRYQSVCAAGGGGEPGTVGSGEPRGDRSPGQRPRR